mgnify:FL=1
MAAYRLIQEGYKVVGVFIKVWHPDFLECNWEEERLDAMRAAAHLKIPFLTCNAEQEYKQEVGEYFVNEYLAGRTPNPDVMCNQHVKFGAFLRFALENGADYIATGHYARVQTEDNQVKLLRGVDEKKDQTYFLWTLTQEELKHVLFPVGDTPKEEIREEAVKAGLKTATKKDSQGICFLGHVDIPQFLSHFTDLKSGMVLDKDGNEIGEHQGALVYTLGQRHGFTLTNENSEREKLFVVAKNLENNTITVDTKPPKAKDEAIKLESVNWITNPPKNMKCEASFRYRQTSVPVSLIEKDGDWEIVPEMQIDQPACGQSCVLYAGDECLGGGIIS